MDISYPIDQQSAPGPKLVVQRIDKCPVCRLDIKKEVFKIKDTSVYRCKYCGLKYLGDDFPEEMTETMPQLEGYFNYDNPESKTSRDFNRALGWIEENHGWGRIMDVGAGNGFFLSIAEKRNWDVDGLDLSFENAKIAWDKFKISLITDDFLNIGAPRVYDVVSFWDLIEHLKDPHPMIKKAADVLRPNGLVLIAVPNDRSLIQMIAAMLYRLGMRQGVERLYFLEHVSYFDLETLRRLMHYNGFKLIHHFQTSTDLNKFNFKWWERLIARTILTLGRIFRLENRIVAVFKKESQ